MAPTLGYWDIRGLAEPIRYLFHYKGIDFEDKRYRSYDSWKDEKFNLGLDFPNLPYLIDGDLRITQSLAILRHLARKYNLAGSTEKESVVLEMVEQQVVDLRTNIVRLAYSDNFEKQKPEFLKNAPAQLKFFSTFLGDKKFLAGDSVTYVDFMAYDTFDFYELMDPSLFKDFANLKAYMRRFEELPELQKYLKSSTYKRWPIFGPVASFGGTGEEPKRE